VDIFSGGVSTDAKRDKIYLCKQHEPVKRAEFGWPWSDLTGPDVHENRIIESRINYTRVAKKRIILRTGWLGADQHSFTCAVHVPFDTEATNHGKLTVNFGTVLVNLQRLLPRSARLQA
jgi:hypothetical protein